MEEVCIKRVWTGSCVNERFGLVSKKFCNEVFIVDVVYFDEWFGFDRRFGLVNKEFVGGVFIVVMNYYGDYFGDYFSESSLTRDQRRLDESGTGRGGSLGSAKSGVKAKSGDAWAWAWVWAWVWRVCYGDWLRNAWSGCKLVALFMDVWSVTRYSCSCYD